MRFFLLIFMLFSGALSAQDEPLAVLKTQLEPAGPVLVGEPIRLKVDVLVTTWLTRAPVFPDLEIEGALVMLPDERARSISERIDGKNWFGVSRSYLVYPQEAREFQIPPAEIIVTYGQADEPAVLPLEQLTFRARIPSEARGLGYFIATTGFQLTQEFDRELNDLKVGESIRRTIRLSAEKTFAMFLPPVEFEQIEGLSVYPDPPRINDRSDERLGFQGGDRIDSATYLIQEEGDYELDAFKVYWWDLTADRMQEAIIPAVQFSAGPNPDYVPEIPLPESEEEVIPEQEKTWYDWLKQWAIPLLVIAIAIPFVFRFLSHLTKRIRTLQIERRERYLKSEKAAFDQVETAARKGDARAIISRLYQWIDRINEGDNIPTLNYSVNDPRFENQIEELIASVYSDKPSQQEKSGRTLISWLKSLRMGIKERKDIKKQLESQLPSLNPVKRQ
jgi:hypothetical protein